MQNLAVFDSFPPLFDTSPSSALRECCLVYITGTRVRSVVMTGGRPSGERHCLNTRPHHGCFHRTDSLCPLKKFGAIRHSGATQDREAPP